MRVCALVGCPVSWQGTHPENLMRWQSSRLKTWLRDIGSQSCAISAAVTRVWTVIHVVERDGDVVLVEWEDFASPVLTAKVY